MIFVHKQQKSVNFFDVTLEQNILLFRSETIQ